MTYLDLFKRYNICINMIDNRSKLIKKTMTFDEKIFLLKDIENYSHKASLHLQMIQDLKKSVVTTEEYLKYLKDNKGDK